MDAKLKIEYLPINDLKPYDKNTRKHKKADVDVIKKSIEQFGMCDPIGIWSKENIIVEGHGRLLALKELGYTEVPVIRLDHLTDKQRRAYAIEHNRSAELSDWDDDFLNQELTDLKDDFNFEDLGFDELFKEPERTIIQDDEFDLDAALKQKQVSMPGDIYLLGKHKLMCGNSVDEDSVEKLVGEERIDLFLTDPPYNVDYVGKTKDKLKIQNDNMSNSTFREFLTTAFKLAASYMKKGASFYICHADSEGYNFRGACIDAGLTVKQCIIWNKNSMVMGRQDYQWKHEPILYGWKEGESHNWYSDRRQTTVIDMDRPTKSELHPTMKPIGLFSYLIKNSSKSGDVVLDLFGGSGTSIIAAEQIDRVCLMMELDPHYVDVIVRRYVRFMGSSNDCYLIRNGKKQTLPSDFTKDIQLLD